MQPFKLKIYVSGMVINILFVINVGFFISVKIDCQGILHFPYVMILGSNGLFGHFSKTVTNLHYFVFLFHNLLFVWVLFQRKHDLFQREHDLFPNLCNQVLISSH